MVNNIISAQQLHVVGPLGSERIKILLLVKIPNKLGDNQMPFLFNRCVKWPTNLLQETNCGVPSTRFNPNKKMQIYRFTETLSDDVRMPHSTKSALKWRGHTENMTD